MTHFPKAGHNIVVDAGLVKQFGAEFVTPLLSAHFGSANAKDPDVADAHENTLLKAVWAGDHTKKLVTRQPYGNNWFRLVTKWSRKHRCVLTRISKEAIK